MNVSVIMPVFNRERFIDEAIESVLQQDFDGFELVIVDDGSTDGTAKILERWKQTDPRVVLVIAPSNEGIPAAHNRGLARARGRYIARLDSDDVMMPGRLAAQAAVLDTHPEVSLVSSAYELIDSNGSHLGLWRGDEPHEVVLLLLNFFNIIGGGSQVMFRTADAVAEGGYAEHYPSSDDYYMWTRLLRRGRLVTLPTIGMKQRDHGDRSLRRYGDVKRANWHGIMRESLELYLDRTVEREEIDALITLWRLDGERGAFQTADAIMREAYDVFCGKHDERRLRRIATRRIAQQWVAAAKAYQAAGEAEEAAHYFRMADAWQELQVGRRATIASADAVVQTPARMTAGLKSGDVVIGCVTENKPKYLAQTTRLLQSIRWFGGELAKSRMVVCAVEAISPRARERFESLGAEVRVVERFDVRNGSSNRLQMLEEVWDGPERVVVSLDCDILIGGDILPFLDHDAFQAKVAPATTVGHETFVRLFDHFNVPLPARTFITGYTGEPSVPYFNAGVIALPREFASRLLPEWRRYTTALLAEPEILGSDVVHLHQAALTLALVTSRVPIRELPVELNFQINMTHLPTPPSYLDLEPLVVHYHHLADEAGPVHSTIFPGAQRQIERFNRRLREERWNEQRRFKPKGAAPSTSRIAVLGMHRSGTSVVGELLHAMGCYAGSSDDLPAGDEFNPSGYWEHRAVVRLNEEILDALGSGWLDPTTADVDALSDEQREAFVQRAGEIVREMDAHGTWMIKDPRLSILFPIWREAMADPIVVVPWRHPAAVARSLQRRDGMPLTVGVALWEEYTRRILASTSAAQRVLLSYEALVESPERAVRELLNRLSKYGVAGLALPSPAVIERTVNAQFNRSDRADISLTADQTTILEVLEDGDEKESPLITCSSEGTRELLFRFARDPREFSVASMHVEKLHRELEARRADLDALLATASRKHEGELEAAREAFAEREGLAQVRLEEMERMFRADIAARESANASERARLEDEWNREREELIATSASERDTARRQREELELTLNGVFGSRSWRIGYAVTRLWRRLFPTGIESAEDRWKRERSTRSS